MMKRMSLGFGLAILLMMHWACGSSDKSPASPAAPPAYTYPFLFAIGDYGTGNGQLNGPDQIAVYNNTIFVNEEVDNRIQKFDLSGNFLAEGNLHTAGGMGCGLVIDKYGTLYVTDYKKKQIETMDANFNYKATYGPAIGSFTLGEPVGLTMDAAGVSILVADGSAGPVYRFNTTFTAGVSIAFPFTFPFAVAEDKSGNVYVADYGANNVIKFNSSLASPATIVGTGTTNGLVSSPTDVCLDWDGNLLVADHTGRVQKFSNTGSYIAKISGPGTNPGQFGVNNNLHVAVDPNKNVYVSDNYNCVVDKFAPY